MSKGQRWAPSPYNIHRDRSSLTYCNRCCFEPNIRISNTMSQTFYRETRPTSPRSSDRYLASDFKRLTIRRLTTPASTPDFQFAHEPRAERPNKCPSGVAISDKRASKTVTPTTRQSVGIVDVNIAQSVGSGQSSSCSSSTGEQLDTCVKEDNSGELPPCYASNLSIF